MAEIITMPRLSDTMEEGVVAKWLKKVGDTIKEGDILAEIETDKATMEFEAFYSGILLHIAINEGECAPVDKLLAIIGEKGEDISGIISENKQDDSKKISNPKEEVANAKTEEKADLPDGVQIITMPRLSDTMEEGTVAKWLKKEGENIKEGDILAEIETDKATMEFESFYVGSLLHIGVKNGESAPVDSVLAIIGNKGTDISAVLSNLKKSDGAPKKVTPQPKSELKSDVPIKKSSKTSHNDERILASPLAKKLAEEHHINLSRIKGSGDNGRIIKFDIDNFASGGGSTFSPVGEEMTENFPNSQMRKTIAKRLAESKFTAPHYYLLLEVDMENAITFRNQINSIPNTKVSFNDLVVKGCATALKEHLKVNSSWTDAVTEIHNHVSIGVAVAVDDGLVVPVLKFTDQMSLTQIGGKVKELAVKARDKKLTPEEMTGSTFTVSNLGMFGIQEFTSIINQPNSAILSVGTIVEKPIVKNGQIVVGNTMKLSLACDHRTIDGATGAEFLQTLKSYIENPVKMIL